MKRNVITSGWMLISTDGVWRLPLYGTKYKAVETASMFFSPELWTAVQVEIVRVKRKRKKK